MPGVDLVMEGLQEDRQGPDELGDGQAKEVIPQLGATSQSCGWVPRREAGEQAGEVSRTECAYKRMYLPRITH